MDTDPNLPPEIGIDQARDHLQTAANGRAYRVIDLMQQPATAMNPSPIVLIFSSPCFAVMRSKMTNSASSRDTTSSGSCLIAIGREIGHVAEQHRDVLVPPRNHGADTPDLVGGYFWEQSVQQQVGLLTRVLGFDSASCRAS